MIVITGPNGNVSTELVGLLRKQNTLAYRIAAHTPEKIRTRYGEDAPVVRFDYEDQTTWPATLKDISTLFLLFPLPHPRTAKTWMVPFVDAAVTAGCSHIVYISVPGADTRPIVPHHTVEKCIRESGVPFTILQASYFAQNLERVVSTHWVDIAKYDEIFIPARRGLHSFLDSRDLGEAALNILRAPEAHRNQTYLVTGPEALDFYQVAEIMSEELGRPIRNVDPSFPRYWWRMLRRRVGLDVLFFMTIAYVLSRTGKNAPMTDTLGKLLDRPPLTMRDYIRDHCQIWASLPSDAVTPTLRGEATV